jgi:two-component system, NtrC family, response regulator
MANPVLLIVDDDEEIRTQMKWALAKDYDVALAGNRAEALAAFRAKQPAVVWLDLGLPPHPAASDEGLATLAELLAADSRTKVVIVSGQNDKGNALQAVGAGAYDFLCKPVDLDELKPLLKRCFYVSQLEREFRDMQHQLKVDAFEGLLGTSTTMQRVFDSIRKVATTDAPVLILGESGTGKEMAARAIHSRSPRKNGPFVAINCSAIPEALLESELFGHEKGAFTGAHVQRKGRIESAEGGTLFLDEIGEVPLAIQVKLLRFLQEKTIERVGGRQEIAVDARILAATNADLQKGMTDGTFREDLFYRLAVVQIPMPALRDRDGDIALLAQAFLQRFADESHKAGLAFSPDALRVIQRHSWPGNVRELQNRVRRGVVMSEGKRIGPSDLDLKDSGPGPANLSLKDARETLDREMVHQALRRNRGKITAAAADLGISRPTLYELMEKLGVQKPEQDHP